MIKMTSVGISIDASVVENMAVMLVRVSQIFHNVFLEVIVGTRARQQPWSSSSARVLAEVRLIR